MKKEFLGCGDLRLLDGDEKRGGTGNCVEDDELQGCWWGGEGVLGSRGGEGYDMRNSESTYVFISSPFRGLVGITGKEQGGVIRFCLSWRIIIAWGWGWFGP